MADDGARVLFRATAHNRSGATGESWVDGGVRVAVRSPLAPREGTPAASGGTNPEELLALAWATCLNASARVVAGDDRAVAVRVEVDLLAADPGTGYEFAPRAHLSFEGTDPVESARLAGAAHARCPVSKLLSGRGSVTVASEPYAER